MHLMIDLETLGTDVDCVVTQIGWAVFDFTSTYASDLIRPDAVEQIREKKRSITWDTFIWWLKQDENARLSMAKGPLISMEDGLKAFIMDIDIQTGWDKIQGVWSHGLTFDVAIMEHLFRQYKIKCPWKYNTPRDTRTIFMLVPDMAFHKATIAHNAKEDAIVQTYNIQKAMKFITVNKDL